MRSLLHASPLAMLSAGVAIGLASASGISWLYYRFGDSIRGSRGTEIKRHLTIQEERDGTYVYDPREYVPHRSDSKAWQDFLSSRSQTGAALDEHRRRKRSSATEEVEDLAAQELLSTMKREVAVAMLSLGAAPEALGLPREAVEAARRPSQ